MEVLKVFNNNVVLARGDDGRDLVVTGRGIGFGVKRGESVDETRVTHRFPPDAHHDANQLSAFLTEIPPEHLGLAVEILKSAESALGASFAQSMVIPLADHISFAIKRVRQHIDMGSPLRAEVIHLYPNEYRVATDAVALIRERTGVPLPDEEAVPIALHFVNALFATDDLSRTFRMTELFRQVFEVLDSSYGRHFDIQSINAARFITHLRYFFVRIDADKQLASNPATFVATIKTSFAEAHLCAERIRALLELRLEKPVTPDEVVYLTLHVARLASEQ